MGNVPLQLLSEIPYLNHEALAGRFLSSLMFLDNGEWHTWLVAGAHGDQRLFKMQAWPAEACYFAREAAQPGDLTSPAIDFTGRIACYFDVQKVVTGLHDDIFNLSASLAKLDLLQASFKQVPEGLSRMAATEVEYIILVCRSIFDLFQEVMLKLWNRIELNDSSRRKRSLKPSFAKTILAGGEVLSPDDMVARYGLPSEIAACYGRATEIFLALRRFRDGIVHHGSQVQHVFAGDGEFLIASYLRPFADMVIWEDHEKRENDLVPLLPALEVLIARTLTVCDDFCLALARHIQFPAGTVPHMRLFMRGYFMPRLITALSEGARRSRFAEPKKAAL